MKKEDQPIMAVKREKLFEDNYFQGFLPAERVDFITRILKNYKYIRRKDAEESPQYKQPIGYIVLINKEKNKIFAYQRAVKNEKITEKRLKGMWSLGIGGHIDKVDAEKRDPIRMGVLREMDEEVNVEDGVIDLKLVGYINDESNSVGKVHFGLLYLAKTKGDIVPMAPEIKEGELKNLKEIRRILKNKDYKMEEWSKIILENIEYFK